MVEITASEFGLTVLAIVGLTAFLVFHIGYIAGSLKEKQKVMEYSMKNTMHMVEEMIKDLYPLETKNK